MGALTPELALAYLRGLSADLLDGVVLAPDGARLAGPEPLAEAARALLAAEPDAEAAQVALPGGLVIGARSQRHALAVAYGPHALAGLALHDVRRALADLA